MLKEKITHTRKAALRSMWVIPNVLGVSWRLAALINNPTRVLGDRVSSEATLRPFSNVETWKKRNNQAALDHI